jgi:hypothetical protein
VHALHLSQTYTAALQLALVQKHLLYQGVFVPQSSL